ncbi:MAG: SpoVR family protein [Bdellovibrionales bacterium RBG_16_40_8]|nr:MAG: SpoVR family protein [Bdellovibrionales bacterium RBG_16_40_8]
MANLTPELERERVKICAEAKAAGLDFFETIFELVTYKQLNEIAAKGGFPTRYPHWRFGMDFEQLSKSYEFGLSKIYELVINNDPCYAYLMEGNDLVDQKLVMAHVYAHCDFFKNNLWFSQTSRKMIDQMANHAVRVRRHIDFLGLDIVEDFIDKCLSLENLIDVYSVYKKQGSAKNTAQKDDSDTRPQRDVLKFLLDRAPLEDWQRNILSIIRDEAYYFTPQAMTKIMNEGWASYWHAKLMTEKILHDCEIVDFADRHSGALVMPPSGFNPYKIGIELFRTIEQRWNKGQFGKEWAACDDLEAKRHWDMKTGKGLEKIFQVRRDYNDVTFIDEFLTEDFCHEHKMFVYRFNKRTGQFEVDNRDFTVIKKKFLFQITNMGMPIISVVDHNHNGRGELLLTHLFEGVEMQPDYMKATMENLFALGKKPIHLATVMDGEGRIYSWNGQEFNNILFGDIKASQSDLPEDKKDTEEEP